MRESSEFWEFSPSYLQRQLIICGSLFSGGWFRRGQHGRLCWPPERMSLSDYIRPVLSLLRSSSLACFTVETSRGRPCCFVFTTENQRCLSAEFLLNDVRRGRGCGPHVARRESDCEHVEKIYRKLEKEKKERGKWDLSLRLNLNKVFLATTLEQKKRKLGGKLRIWFHLVLNRHPLQLTNLPWSFLGLFFTGRFDVKINPRTTRRCMEEAKKYHSALWELCRYL